MVLKLHFKIKSSKFTKMAVCVRVFSTKNRSNFKNTLKITAESHLFVKLRRLSKTSFLFKIL